MKETVSADQHPASKADTNSGRCRKAATGPTCSDATGAEACATRPNRRACRGATGPTAPSRFCVAAAVTRAKLLGLAVEDEGMSTVEYAKSVFYNQEVSGHEPCRSLPRHVLVVRRAYRRG